jgi:hypothetical protein
MKRSLLLPLCLLLPACALFQRPRRPVHAPPEEAAKVEFPLAFPTEGRQGVSGAMAAAIALALDDYRPRDLQPPAGATPQEACLYRRESYDVLAAPGPEGVMFVSIALNPDACGLTDPIMDMGATYAIDVRGGRVLAVQH